MGIEEMVLHPDEGLPGVVLPMLAAGIVLSQEATDLGWWRATRRHLPARSIVGLALTVLVVFVELDAPPEIIMVVSGLVSIAVLEQIRKPGRELTDAP